MYRKQDKGNHKVERTVIYMFDNDAKCRVCGCTNNNACITDKGPCWWVADDLCSACTFKVVTLCGSSRFKKEFEEANQSLTLLGNIVISVGVFKHADNIEISDEEKDMLDEIHLQKIDMADEIFVINVGGYIGSSTKREIEYAKSKGIPVRYLESI